MQLIAYFLRNALSLKHAILVMLEQEPSSGYDLLKHFKESLGYFWNAKHQQIYKQLKQMHEDGLIDIAPQSTGTNQDKKIYAIAPAGREELCNWFEQPVAPSKVNDALLVKLYGTSETNKKLALEELQRHIALHQHTLDKLLAIEQRYKALSVEEQTHQQFPYLTLRRGIIGEKAWLEWAQEAIHLFKK